MRVSTDNAILDADTAVKIFGSMNMATSTQRQSAPFVEKQSFGSFKSMKKNKKQNLAGKDEEMDAGAEID